MFDKNNIFKQSWLDVVLNPKEKQVGVNIQDAKKIQAHEYISSYVSVTNAIKTIQ